MPNISCFFEEPLDHAVYSDATELSANCHARDVASLYLKYACEISVMRKLSFALARPHEK